LLCVYSNLDDGNWWFFHRFEMQWFWCLGVLVSLNELSNSNRIVSKQLTIVLKSRNVLGS